MRMSGISDVQGAASHLWQEDPVVVKRTKIPATAIYGAFDGRVCDDAEAGPRKIRRRV